MPFTELKAWLDTQPKRKKIYTRKPGPSRGVVFKPLHERFHEKVERLESGCWRWTGSIPPHGYGMIYIGRVNGRSTITVAHRVAYELYRGEIPDGLVLDHLCRNRWCVNPDHLEPVTFRENVLRGEAPMVAIHRSGRCKNGHEMTDDNLYVDRNGNRYCRTCQIAYHREERRRKREAKGGAA